MNKIFLHQLHDHLKSLRFQVSLIVLLFFFAGNGVIYTWRMDRLIREVAKWDASNENGYGWVKNLNHAVDKGYGCLNHPLGTEFIAEGGADWFPDMSSFTAETGGGTPSSGKGLATNHWMEPFRVVDWMLVVRLVLSFLCIVLAYDAISGEVESGTLRLTLANSLSRGRFLAGKFLAHLTILSVATILGTMISLLILSRSDVFALNARVLRGYGMFLLGTVLYISLFLFLSMGISAMVRSSASSLVVLVLIWAVLSVVIPQTSYLIGVRTVKSPGHTPGVLLANRQDEVMEETMKRLAREGIWLRDREMGKTDNYAMEKRYADSMREAEKKMDRLGKAIDDLMVRQYRAVKKMNLLSPGFAFQYTIEAFLGTGDIHYEHFMRQVWRYRDTLREFIRSRDATDPDSPHVLFLPGYLSDKPLDPNDIPRFKSVPLSLAKGIAAGLVPIIILVLEAALAFFFALWTFNRAEIAG